MILFLTSLGSVRALIEIRLDTETTPIKSLTALRAASLSIR